MFENEFRVALAHTVALNRCATSDVAMLWNGEKLIQMQSAPSANLGGWTLALPIVNLLRNRGERLAKGFSISASAPPTEACLGMARMCGIDSILYLAGGKVVKVTCRRNGTFVQEYDPTFKGPIANVMVGSNRGPVPGAWQVKPSDRKKELLAWANGLRGKGDAVAAAVEVAAMVPVATGGPPVSVFGSSGLEFLGLSTWLGNPEVVDNVLMLLAFEMVAQVSGFSRTDRGVVSIDRDQRAKAYEGQNIGSLLADAEGNVVAWGFNTNSENSTRHGEINLLTSYVEQNGGIELPNGGAIYTTLEPCEMCSGAIARMVPPAQRLRVIYAQKDDNVFMTALQRKVHAGVTMEPSKVNLATFGMIKSGSGTGAKNGLVTGMSQEQGKQNIVATTQFLKTKGTFEKFFGAARPNWWLYLWDHLSARTAILRRDPATKGDVLLKDPEVMRLNTQLDNMHLLVEQFMQTVRRQAAPR